MRISGTDRQYFLGFSLAILAGLCWGSMSVIGQMMSGEGAFSAEDLGCLRVFGAGLLLSAVAALKTPGRVRSLFSDRRRFTGVLIYGLGVLAVQYTFFLSIRAAGAATAALMVTTAPLFVILTQAVRGERRVQRAELAAFAMALTGVALLVSKGDFTRFDLSVAGVGFGLLSAACGAFCTLQPRRVIAELGVMPVVGFGMLFSGALSTVFHPPWAVSGTLTPLTVAGLAYLIVVGTALAFIFYLKSLSYVPAAVSVILVAFEPLSAIVLSVWILGVDFNGFEIAGILTILAMVGVLAAAALRQPAGR